MSGTHNACVDFAMYGKYLVCCVGCGKLPKVRGGCDKLSVRDLLIYQDTSISQYSWKTSESLVPVTALSSCPERLLGKVLNLVKWRTEFQAHSRRVSIGVAAGNITHTYARKAGTIEEEFFRRD